MIDGFTKITKKHTSFSFPTPESSNHSHSRNATVVTRLSGHGAHNSAHAVHGHVHGGSSRINNHRSSPMTYGFSSSSNGRIGARPSIVADGASNNSPVIQVLFEKGQLTRLQLT